MREIVSWESQKGVITIQQCSIENQELGRYYCTQFIVIAPFWFSTEYRAAVLMLFIRSDGGTDEK